MVAFFNTHLFPRQSFSSAVRQEKTAILRAQSQVLAWDSKSQKPALYQVKLLTGVSTFLCNLMSNLMTTVY